MKVGLPKEIKNNENRVALIPASVVALVNAGHQVFVESNAGIGSSITDLEYQEAGATIVATAKEAWDSEIVVKVKEPLQEEYGYFKENQILFTYLHLAAEKALVEALKASKVTAIAYETIQLSDNSLPLLAPMSEVAGRRAITITAHYLEKINGGQGILLSGVPGTQSAHIVILGAGIAGLSAAKMAIGLGAKVTILDVNLPRLRMIDDLYKNQIQTLYSNEMNIANVVKDADAIISTVLIPGAKAPKLVKEYMVKEMKPGSIIIDIAIDQGGSVETIDRHTTLDDPIFIKHDVLHYAVPNMPGAVPRTSTFALTNATLSYLLKLANDGVKASLNDPSLLKGINVMDGKITCPAVAEAMNESCENAYDILFKK